MSDWAEDEDRWRSRNDPSYPGYRELHHAMIKALKTLATLEGVVFAADPKERPMIAQEVVRLIANNVLAPDVTAAEEYERRMDAVTTDYPNLADIEASVR